MRRWYASAVARRRNCLIDVKRPRIEQVPQEYEIRWRTFLVSGPVLMVLPQDEIDTGRAAVDLLTGPDEVPDDPLPWMLGEYVFEVLLGLNSGLSVVNESRPIHDKI